MAAPIAKVLRSARFLRLNNFKGMIFHSRIITLFKQKLSLDSYCCLVMRSWIYVYFYYVIYFRGFILVLVNSPINKISHTRYWSKKAANLKGLYQKGRTRKAANLKGRRPQKPYIFNSLSWFIFMKLYRND